MDVVALFLGVPLGVLASFAAWWIVTHWLVPAVEFSPHISRNEYSGNASGINHRVKFKNIGKREIIDLEVFAELRVKGLNPSLPGTIEVARLVIDDARMPFMKVEGTKIIALKPEQTERFDRPVYGESINSKRAQGLLTLEDVLSLNQTAVLVIYVFGYDRWSGARKLYTSVPYTLQDVRTGRWSGMSIPLKQADHE